MIVGPRTAKRGSTYICFLSKIVLCPLAYPQQAAPSTVLVRRA